MQGICLVSLIMLHLGAVTARASQITVVFRFDDYCTCSDTAVETRVIELFRAHALRCTFSVVPYIWGGWRQDLHTQELLPLSAEKAALLKEAMVQGAVDVALHSYSHEMLGPRTEFAGLAYEEQLARIVRGRDLVSTLLGVPVTTFVPAWDTYDAATLRALREAGFQCLSANRYGVPEAQEPSPLRFLPYVCELTGLRDAVEWARQTGDGHAVIVALFHSYDFREAQANPGPWSIEAFGEILRWTASQPDVVIRSIGELLETDMDLSARRFEDNRRLMAKRPGYIPPFLGRLFGLQAPLAYLSSDTIHARSQARQKALLSAHAGAVAFHAVVGCVAALAAVRLKARMSVPVARTAVVVSRYAAALLVLAAAGVSLHDGGFGYRCAVLVAASLGLVVGMQWRISPEDRVKPIDTTAQPELEPRVNEM